MLVIRQLVPCQWKTNDVFGLKVLSAGCGGGRVSLKTMERGGKKVSCQMSAPLFCVGVIVCEGTGV